MGDVTAAGSGGAGLGTQAARWALLAVWALGALTAAIQGDFEQLDLVRVSAYLVSLPSVILLTTPGDRTLDRPRALAVVSFALATAALVFSSDPTLRQTWLFNLSVYIVALLIARGNATAGGVGGAILIALGAACAWADGWTATAVAELVGIPIVALLVGSVWRLALRRIVASERRHRSEQAHAALAAELAEQTAASDRRELTEVFSQVVLPLSLLARGRELDERFRSELTLIEATIRDRIRAPWAQHPALAKTIAAQRRVGVDVLLLGEREEPLSEQLSMAAAGLIEAALDRVAYGSVTLRVAPPGREHVLSVLLRGDAQTMRVLLAADGSVLSQR